MATPVTANATDEENEKKSNATWFKFLYQSSDQALETIFINSPKLLEKTVSLVCLSPYSQDGCYCAYKFESLSIINSDFDKLYSLVTKGACPHVEVLDTDHQCSEDDCQTLSPDIFKKVDRSTITKDTEIDDATRFIFLEGRQKECDTFVNARVKPVHIAASQGRAKLVEKILKLTENFDENGIYSCSGLFSFIPLHNAIVHNNVSVAQVISKCRIQFNVVPYQVLYNTFNVVPYHALYNGMHAAIKDSIPLLKACMQLKFPFRSCIEYAVLAAAAKFKCYRTLKFIVNNGAKIDHTFHCYLREKYCRNLDSRKLLTDLIHNNETTIIKIALRNRKVVLRRFLSTSVYYDNVEAVEFMISIAKRRKKLIKDFIKPSRGGNSLLIQATLNNSPGMLRVLLKGKLDALFETYDKYTAHTWAYILGFSECTEILKEASVPYDCKVLKNYPPTVAVFHKYVDSYRNSKSKLIQILSSKGWDFVCETANGISPLYMTLEHHGYAYVRMLLQKGIDPYKERNCIRSFISRRLLGEMLYANVDIFRKRPDISLVSQILYTSTGFRSELGFLLRHAHTVPVSDRIRLGTLENLPDTSIPDVVKKDIRDFLTSPKTLQSMARDSIRRHYGIKIFDFVSRCNLSQRLKSLITMEDILKPYLEVEFDNVKQISWF